MNSDDQKTREDLIKERDFANQQYDEFLNKIAAETDAPRWDYAGQVVRDVRMLKESRNDAVCIASELRGKLSRMQGQVGMWESRLLDLEKALTFGSFELCRSLITKYVQVTQAEISQEGQDKFEFSAAIDHKRDLKLFQVDDGETHFIAAYDIHGAYLYWRTNCGDETDLDALSIEELSEERAATIQVGDDDTNESKSLVDWLKTVKYPALLGSTVF